MSADLLARLIDAGTPTSLVAEVAMELARAGASANALESRRRADRERQANRRAASRDITLDRVTDRDTPDNPAPSPPSPKDPQTPKEPQPPHPHPGEKPRARKGRAYPPPARVTEERWSDFCRQRKKPLTDGAYTLICSKLDKLAEAGWPPGDMIDLAIERGWETVYEPRERRNGCGKPSGWIDA